MTKRLFAAAALAAVTLISPNSLVLAQDVDVSPDVECLLALSILTQNDDPKIKQAGTLGVMLFAGKVLGGDPDIDLNARLLEAAKALDEKQLPVIYVRCAKEMEESGERISAAGQYLTEQGF